MQTPAESRVGADVDGVEEARLDEICVALVNQGYCVVDAILPQVLLQDLQQEAIALARTSFKPAGTGRGEQYQHAPQVRSDLIRWLERDSTASAAYLDWADHLREGINSRLFLGLFAYECHYACYAPGAFYGRHKDAFAGPRNRLISTVLYLNDSWHADDGGELVLYAEDGKVLERVLPVRNRMALFLSELVPHEVLPAQRHRYSLAGWFRLRAP